MYHDLTEGKISRSLLLFALPMMAGNLLQQFYNIADTLIVGRVLGSNALAAVGSHLYSDDFPDIHFSGTQHGIRCTVFYNAYSTFIAQNYGAGKKNRIRKGTKGFLKFSISVAFLRLFTQHSPVDSTVRDTRKFPLPAI